MSALGQKQTCAQHKLMSALCQKRTFRQRTAGLLVDEFVDNSQDSWWNRETKLFCCA
jgi:hypothetical protein